MPTTMPTRAGVVLTIAAAVLLARLAVRTVVAEAGCRGAGSHTLSKAAAKRALFCLVNRERTTRGLPALRRNGRLARVARRHARDAVRYQFIGHTSPRRGTLLTRIRRSGYRPRHGRAFAFGEILGAGRARRAAPRRIVREWMRRQIHRTAILYGGFRVMGIGASRGMPSRNMKRRGRNYVITFAG